MCQLCGLSLLSSLIITGVGFMMQHRKNKSFENKIIELIKAHNELVHIFEPIKENKTEVFMPIKEEPALYQFKKHDDYFKK